MRAIVQLVLAALAIIGLWNVFVKAGKPGWAAIIPIYNIIVMLQIAGKPMWWIILLFIPIVNIVIIILVNIEIAKVFGKSAGFGVGMALLGFVFYPILGLGDAQYVGAAPAVATAAPPPPPPAEPGAPAVPPAPPAPPAQGE